MSDAATGIVATITAVGVVATLMIVGIKMKLPPPDPDWRKHLPVPGPPMDRPWMFVRFGPLVASFVALVVFGGSLALGWERLARVMAVLVVALAFLRVAGAFAWGLHVARYRRRLRQGDTLDGSKTRQESPAPRAES